MQRGKPIPPDVRRFIVQTADNAPRLTARQITDKVEARFQIKIDSSTAGKIRRKYARGWRAAREHSADAVQASSDRDHRPGNAPDAHVDDLLGLVWSTMEQIKASRSPIRYLDPHMQLRPESDSAFLDVHSLLWESLGEHLPGNPLWEQLARLRSAFEERASSIRELEEIAAREGSELFHAPITDNPPTRGARLTTAFPLAVRSRVLYQSDVAGNDGHGYHLGWQDPGELRVDSSTFITCDLGLDEQEAKDRFREVVELVAGCPETNAAIASIESAESAARVAFESLERIYFRRRLPGRCELCDPNAD